MFNIKAVYRCCRWKFPEFPYTLLLGPFRLVVYAGTAIRHSFAYNILAVPTYKNKTEFIFNLQTVDSAEPDASS